MESGIWEKKPSLLLTGLLMQKCRFGKFFHWSHLGDQYREFEKITGLRILAAMRIVGTR
jgi:hypothetical protein